MATKLTECGWDATMDSAWQAAGRLQQEIAKIAAFQRQEAIALMCAYSAQQAHVNPPPQKWVSQHWLNAMLDVELGLIRGNEP